jgi:hypothetical protein
MTTPKYYLSSHAYICDTGHHRLFLDLLADRYLAVDRGQMALIHPLLHRYGNAIEEDEMIGTFSKDSIELLSDLVAAGVLTLDSVSGRQVRPLQIPLATETLATLAVGPSVGTRVIHFPRVILALANAHRSLSRQSIYGTVHRISRTKRERRNSMQSIPLETLSRLIAIFNSLRAFYPRDYVCLFDSLALLEFLIPFGVRADWIFGVASDPFAAHCWLQQGNVVLNDPLEKVAGYCPILAV